MTTYTDHLENRLDASGAEIVGLKEQVRELKEREQKYIKALSILMPECEMNNMTQPALAVLGDLIDKIPAEKRPLRWECKLG